MPSTDTPNTVSVLVPCYNAADHLGDALDSALAQTHRPIEILVVDDGSKDNSPQVANSYIQRFPDRGIRLIQQPNGGEPAARNTGIQAATGAWVAMLDADDWWNPTKLEMQLITAQEAGDECVLVHTGVTHHFPDGRVEPKDLKAPARRTGWCTQALLEPSSIGHPSIMVRRAALNQINGYDESFKQACDIDLYFRLSAVGTFGFVPEHLLHYRIHANQMSADQVSQIHHHHRAARNFFAAYPSIAQQIGWDQIQASFARHVAIKLKSLYWQRRLEEFRQLLQYAKSQQLENPEIRLWRRRAATPDWLIWLKDRLASGRDSA